MPVRKKIWEKLAGEWKLDLLDDAVTETTLDELSGVIDRMLERKHRGRTVVTISP